MRKKLAITAYWLLFEVDKDGIGTGEFKPQSIEWKGKIHDYRDGVKENDYVVLTHHGSAQDVAELFDDLRGCFKDQLLDDINNECAVEIISPEEGIFAGTSVATKKFHIKERLTKSERRELAVLLNANESSARILRGSLKTVKFSEPDRIPQIHESVG